MKSCCLSLRFICCCFKEKKDNKKVNLIIPNQLEIPNLNDLGTPPSDEDETCPRIKDLLYNQISVNHSDYYEL